MQSAKKQITVITPCTTQTEFIGQQENKVNDKL